MRLGSPRPLTPRRDARERRGGAASPLLTAGSADHARAVRRRRAPITTSRTSTSAAFWVERRTVLEKPFDGIPQNRPIPELSNMPSWATTIYDLEKAVRSTSSADARRVAHYAASQRNEGLASPPEALPLSHGLADPSTPSPFDYPFARGLPERLTARRKSMPCGKTSRTHRQRFGPSARRVDQPVESCVEQDADDGRLTHPPFGGMRTVIMPEEKPRSCNSDELLAHIKRLSKHSKAARRNCAEAHAIVQRIREIEKRHGVMGRWSRYRADT